MKEEGKKEAGGGGGHSRRKEMDDSFMEFAEEKPGGSETSCTLPALSVQENGARSKQKNSIRSTTVKVRGLKWLVVYIMMICAIITVQVCACEWAMDMDINMRW